MPFDFHHTERLHRQIEQLSSLRYQHLFSIDSFVAYEDSGENALRTPKQDAKSFSLSVGDYWKGWDRYLWLETKVSIPSDLAAEEIVGIFDFGITGGGNNSQFESLLFVNGSPYQGVDSNHQEVFFPLKDIGTSFLLQFRLWSGLTGGGIPHEIEHQIKRADFVLLDRPTDRLYFMTRSVWETIPLLDENNPIRYELMNLLLKTFRMLNFSRPGSEEFYHSARGASEFLESQLQGQKKLPVSVSMTGHTHIDVGWLWRYRHTREKCARSFSTVNRLMEQYPDYQFLQSQAQLYDFVKIDYPDLYEQIQKRVAEGRWEPAGSMWVECDCNLPSGESIVRQILYGKQFFNREFGYDNDFLWLPDVFGYSWALPQILKKAEINTFVTTKISWNDTNHLPFDTFFWRGIDGTQVLTHFITAPEQSNARYYTYNGHTDPYSVLGVWNNYSNKDTNTDLLIAYGYGDGGGGVNRDMLETMRCVKRVPGLPSVRSESVRSYLTRLNQTMAENPMGGYIPTWDGELYLEFHRGTYTSQAYNKMTNRRLEFAMRNAELLNVMANENQQEKLFEAWKIIMRNQFHDVIPGSSIHEVYEDSREEYKQAYHIIESVNETSLANLVNPCDSCYTIFNTTSWNQSAVINLNGKEILIQDIPPMGSRQVFLDQLCDSQKQPIELNQLETPFYRLNLNESGQITSLFDKEWNREVLQEGAVANVFQLFEDKPREYDAWELEASFEDKMEVISSLTSVCAYQTETGITVCLEWRYYDTMITQKMKLYFHTRRIDFETHINWQEREKILKVAFPVAIRATSARYDIQFGNIERPTTRNTSWEAAKFEVVGHKWADLSETGYGVALLNNCKYGYDVKDSVLRLSLLKGSNFPDYDADRGEHDFTYSLLPHEGNFYTGHVEQQSWEINNPPLVLFGSLKDDRPLFDTNCDHLVIDAVKSAEDQNGIILRVHECAGKREHIVITPSFSCKWQETNLLEHPIGEVLDGPIATTIKPYEIKTFRLLNQK